MSWRDDDRPWSTPEQAGAEGLAAGPGRAEPDAESQPYVAPPVDSLGGPVSQEPGLPEPFTAPGPIIEPVTRPPAPTWDDVEQPPALGPTPPPGLPFQLPDEAFRIEPADAEPPVFRSTFVPSRPELAAPPEPPAPEVPPQPVVIAPEELAPPAPAPEPGGELVVFEPEPPLPPAPQEAAATLFIPPSSLPEVPPGFIHVDSSPVQLVEPPPVPQSAPPAELFAPPALPEPPTSDELSTMPPPAPWSVEQEPQFAPPAAEAVPADLPTPGDPVPPTELVPAATAEAEPAAPPPGRAAAPAGPPARPDINRATLFERIAFGLSIVVPPVGLVASLVGMVLSDRVRGYVTRLLKASAIVGLLLSVVALLVGGGAIDWLKRIAQHDQLVAESADLCGYVSRNPELVAMPDFGWPAPGATIADSIIIIDEYAGRWDTITALAPEAIKEDARLAAATARQLGDSIGTTRQIDHEQNVSTMMTVAAASSIPGWLAEYCPAGS